MIFQPIAFVGEIYRVVVIVLDKELDEKFSVLETRGVQLHGRCEVDLHEFPFASGLIGWRMRNEEQFVFAFNNFCDKLREGADGAECFMQ